MSNHLTKSKYLSGLQCYKRLWYEKNHPERKASTSISQQRRFDQSKEVGILARDHFPEGVLINAIAPPNSVEQTEEAMTEGNSCIFEASFVFNDVLVRCDILQKDSNAWRIIEVKASTSVKEEHLQDLAIQKYLLTGQGVNISETQLMLINNKECVYPDLSNLFIIEDVTDRVDQLMNSVQSNIETFKTILDGNDEPQVLIGEQCDKPNTCPFKTHCWEDIPERSIFTIPYLSKHKKAELVEKGIFSLEDVPANYPLSQKQRAYIDSIPGNQPEINTTAIKHLLSDLEYPIHFLDFETDNPAIPRFDGLRPYQHFPFQYSCHVLHSDGAVEHHEYLHTNTSDPRSPLLESLLNHVSTSGFVVVYKASFERERLKDLAASFPAHTLTLQSIIDRLWDQLVIFQNHYKHPDFGGSNSLKDVLPVLVPSLRYENLDVQDGLEAQAVWNLMLNTKNERGKNEMIEHLKAYCELDTLATLEIHKVLCEL